MSYHCGECSLTLCATCYNESHRDKGHAMKRLSQDVIKKQKLIQEALKDVQPKVDKIGQYVRRLEATSDRVTKEAAAEVREIDDVVKTLIDQLSTKADELKLQVGEAAKVEKKKFAKSIDGLKKILHDFSDLKDKAKNLTHHGDEEAILLEAGDILAQLTKDWSPSVPMTHVVTGWKSKRAELNKMEYGSPDLGVIIDEEQKVRFQFDILSFSGASVTATETNSFTSGFDDWNRTQFCVSDDGYIFMSGKTGNVWNICQLSLDGRKVWETEQVDINDKTIPKPCGLQVVTLADKQFLASSSASQHSILLYDINTPGSTGKPAYSDPQLHFNQMRILPPNTLLVVCAQQKRGRKVLYIRQQDHTSLTLRVTHSMDTMMEDAYGIEVVSTDLTPQGNLIILTSWKTQGVIRAFKLDGTSVWEVRGKVGGMSCNPHGVCADRRGHVYIADGKNRRVLVLSAEDGSLIQTLLTNDQHGIGLVYSVGWSELRDQRFLVVNHRSDRHQQLTTFKIGYQVQVTGPHDGR